MPNDSHPLRRHIKQERARVTVANIAEAAATILTRDGAGRFTTNRVAEEAGINIASIYRYFPNKEALLLHLIHLSWEKKLSRLSPVLAKKHLDDAGRLRTFIREYFFVEARDSDLRRSLRAAAVDIWDTVGYREAISQGSDLLRELMTHILRRRLPSEHFDVNFGVLLVIGMAENSAGAGISEADAVRYADLVSEILIVRWQIC